MRIKQLDLIKYGKFDGQKIDFPAPLEFDFSIIVGPNEAGKSTLRNAITELLFGMPNQTSLAFIHELNELRLGGVLLGTDGEIAFHRARGRAPIRTPADEKLPNDYLAPHLGGATKEFFEQMYGLDHERLVEGGRSILDASKDLGRVLFQSASGVASLAPVMDALESRITELWSKRGSNTEYALADAAYHAATTELKQTLVRTRAWTDAKAQTDQISESIIGAKTDLQQLEAARSKLERIRRLSPLIRDLKIKEAELTALSEVVNLPPNAYEDLKEGQVALSVVRRVLLERQNDLEARQQDREAIATDEAVLLMSDKIEELQEIRGACINHPRDLPLRRMELERLLSEAVEAAAQLGWPTEESALRSILPSKLALKTLSHVAQQHAVLQQASLGAQLAVEEKGQDLQDLRKKLGTLVISDIPANLRSALSEAQALKNSLTSQQTYKTNTDAAERKLQIALTALGGFRKSIEDLQTMDLPSPSRISAIQRQRQTCDADTKNARDRLTEAEAKLSNIQLQEKQFTENSKIVTHADVLAARVSRDESWNNLRTGKITLEAGAPAVDASIRLADELADTELSTTTDAAKLQLLHQQIEGAQADVDRYRKAFQDQQLESDQLLQEWNGLMEKAGLSGMALDDIADWMAKREAVFTSDEEFYQNKQKLIDEQAEYRKAQEALASALVHAGFKSSVTEDLASLASAAADIVRTMDSSRAQKEALEQQIEQTDRALKTLTAKKEQAESTYGQWEEQWQQALLEAKLTAATSTLAQTTGVVELANMISAKLDSVEDIRRNRIQTMENDLDKLESDTLHLCTSLDPSLLQLNDWLAAGRRLIDRLHTARSSAQTARLADDAVHQSRTRLEKAKEQLASAEARVQPLLTSAGVDSVELALPLAERSEKHRNLQTAINSIIDAITKDGDGLSRNAIEAEVAEQNSDAVVADLEQTKRDLSDVNERLSLLAQEKSVAQQAFDAINGASDAAIAEAKRQEALAAMGEAAEQYIEMSTARRLLKWAIDRYRDQKQGPMLQRASEIFSLLTLDEFSRLIVDHEKNPPALLAKRKNGKQVDVSGLSEGTRDQLFLALRIAALELHLEQTSALPFIADDLFVNFDDERSRAGFEALKVLSKHTQVIFLTHHDHLVPTVQEVFGINVNTIRLKREILAA